MFDNVTWYSEITNTKPNGEYKSLLADEPQSFQFEIGKFTDTGKLLDMKVFLFADRENGEFTVNVEGESAGTAWYDKDGAFVRLPENIMTLIEKTGRAILIAAAEKEMDADELGAMIVKTNAPKIARSVDGEHYYITNASDDIFHDVPNGVHRRNLSIRAEEMTALCNAYRKEILGLPPLPNASYGEVSRKTTPDGKNGFVFVRDDLFISDAVAAAAVRHMEHERCMRTILDALDSWGGYACTMTDKTLEAMTDRFEELLQQQPSKEGDAEHDMRMRLADTVIREFQKQLEAENTEQPDAAYYVIDDENSAKREAFVCAAEDSDETFSSYSGYYNVLSFVSNAAAIAYCEDWNAYKVGYIPAYCVLVDTNPNYGDAGTAVVVEANEVEAKMREYSYWDFADSFETREEAEACAAKHNDERDKAREKASESYEPEI